ncbi:helix-turn-helix domain-containing protein [Corallococcus sp. AB045]|uniref:helix-turn-helix domain-containing protein n=1 Tax=Corallococcus sp. AB045 TaxID=2316719 RepID=UPI000ECA1CF2|nr:helix-turn-helix domain-containing protein [Corallococcus sp. AB045]RKH86922.1 helix-turn-helix domain-containing protein [Corallococcus sp. AB045]
MLRELLEARGWTQRVLATVLGRDVSVINRLTADKTRIDGEMALLLEGVFGVPAEQFMDVQSQFELALARVTSRGPDPAMARRAELFGKLPVADMIKRGWLSVQDVRDPRIEASLASFFGVGSPDDIEVLPHAAKKSDAGGPVTPSQAAWLRRAHRIAQEVLVPRYSEATLRAALSQLRPLMVDPVETRHVPKILAECGVRFLIVETLGSAKIDGVCFWVNNGTSPVIAMTLRMDRIDNFWFVLRHEIEHVLRGDGRTAAMVDADLHPEGGPTAAQGQLPEEERLANEAAADFCVPRDKLKKFVAVKAPLFPERDMIGFARTLKVHPGIVAGQLRHATRRYDLFTKHLVKVRSAVSPSATIDGWGDVVPLQELEQ